MGNKQTPEIRLPGFTGDWEQRKLGDLVTIKSGWSPSSFTKGNDQNSSLFIKVDDLNYSSREQNESQMKVLDSPRFIKMKKGSTIFPKRGAAILTNKVRIIGSAGYMDTNMMALEPESINGEFLYTFIGKTGLYKIADTSTIPQINNKHIEPYIICLPSISEQEKIGDLFKQLDDTLAFHQQELDTLKQTKQGFLQKMFPKKGESVPEVRFPGFTGEWEQHKLGDWIVPYVKKTDRNNQYPVLTSSRRGIFFQTDYYKGHQVASKDNTGYNIVPRGYFTYRHMSDDEIFKFNINNIVDYGIVSTLYPVFTTKKRLNSDYLEYQLNNGEEFQHYAILQKQGGSRTYMYLSKLEELKLTIPELPEQIKIGNFFKQLDDTIALHQHELDTLKETKKAFLQKMFV